MKHFITVLSMICSASLLLAQPTLDSMNFKTGSIFNLYALTNVNTGNIATQGADVSWDLTSTTATLVGKAEMLAISATPYETQYPSANLAIKFTPVSGTTVYSLFNLTKGIFEEVANNVGLFSPTTFTDPRTSLVLPFTYTTYDTDFYQKSGDNSKVITNRYDSYGTFVTDAKTYNDVVRIETIDNGNTSYTFWSSSAVAPLFQANSSGFTLWAVDVPTVLNEQIIENSTTFYPNPSNEQITIIREFAWPTTFKITDLSGKCVKTGSLPNEVTTLDVSNLPEGAYILKIEGGNTQYLKLFKE